jgi:hypothetical protein
VFIRRDHQERMLGVRVLEVVRERASARFKFVSMYEHSYTAGLIDGEGTITLTRERKYPFRFPTVSVASTTYELLAWLQKTYGGQIREKKVTKSTHSRSWAWYISRRKALDVLRQAWLFMREPEKIRRARLLLTEYENLTPRNGRYTPNQRDAKLDFERRFFAGRKYARQHLADAVLNVRGSTSPRPPQPFNPFDGENRIPVLPRLAAPSDEWVTSPT